MLVKGIFREFANLFSRVYKQFRVYTSVDKPLSNRKQMHITLHNARRSSHQNQAVLISAQNCFLCRNYSNIGC